MICRAFHISPAHGTQICFCLRFKMFDASQWWRAHRQQAVYQAFRIETATSKISQINLKGHGRGQAVLKANGEEKLDHSKSICEPLNISIHPVRKTTSSSWGRDELSRSCFARGSEEAAIASPFTLWIRRLTCAARPRVSDTRLIGKTGDQVIL